MLRVVFRMTCSATFLTDTHTDIHTWKFRSVVFSYIECSAKCYTDQGQVKRRNLTHAHKHSAANVDFIKGQ